MIPARCIPTSQKTGQKTFKSSSIPFFLLDIIRVFLHIYWEGILERLRVINLKMYTQFRLSQQGTENVSMHTKNIAPYPVDLGWSELVPRKFGGLLRTIIGYEDGNTKPKEAPW